MIFEYATADGKKPNPEEVPTRVFVGGQQYPVKDFCVDVPVHHAADLAMHGFKMRRRDRVEVKEAESPAKDK